MDLRRLARIEQFRLLLRLEEVLVCVMIMITLLLVRIGCSLGFVQTGGVILILENAVHALDEVGGF